MSKAKLAEMGVPDTDQDYQDWLKKVDTHANKQFFALVFICQAGDKYMRNVVENYKMISRKEQTISTKDC